VSLLFGDKQYCGGGGGVGGGGACGGAPDGTRSAAAAAAADGYTASESSIWSWTVLWRGAVVMGDGLVVVHQVGLGVQQ